jgi:hypothetical protein
MKQYKLEELKTYLNTARIIVKEESCDNVRCINCFMHIEDDDCGIWDDNVIILASLGFLDMYNRLLEEEDEINV